VIVPGLPRAAIARAVIEHEPERADQWRLEKFARIALREMEAMAELAHLTGKSRYMDFLPGMDLTDRMPLVRRAPIPLGQATIRDLKDSVKALEAAQKRRVKLRLDTRIGRLKRLISGAA
jgi:hypothetical protein